MGVFRLGIYFTICIVIFGYLEMNVLDKMWWSVGLFGKTIYNVKEIKPVDIWEHQQTELENFGFFSVDYKEEYLKKDINIQLQFSDESKYVEIATEWICSEETEIRSNIIFYLDDREIVYEPISVYKPSESSGSRVYYDEENINIILKECNITRADIKELQDYVLYDVVVRTWIEANGGIYWLEKLKLETCVLDYTFNFAD